MPPNLPKLPAASRASEGLVLLVDDFARLREVLLKTFSRAGIYARGCPSALHALRFLETFKVAVVVSDYQMAGPDGGRFLATVRERYPKARRILLTGNPWGLSAEAKAAAHQVIGKGASTDEVVAAIRFELEEWARGG